MATPKRDPEGRVVGQQTRKPIPRDRVEWARELAGARRVLDAYSHWVITHGSRWASSMAKYWRLRIEDLTRFPPPKPRKGERRRKKMT